MNRYFNSHPGFCYSLLIHLAIFAALFLFSARSILNSPIYREVAEINLQNMPLKKETATRPLEALKPLAATPQQPLQAQTKNASTPVSPKKEVMPDWVQSEIEKPSKEADPINSKNDVAKEVRESGSEAKIQASQPEQVDAVDRQRNNTVSLNDQAQPVTKTSSEAAESAGAWGTYGRGLSQACVKFRRYPASAVASGMRGTVYVAVRIRADGTNEIVVKRTSGFKMLDDEALSMVAQASKVVAIPDILKGKARELIIPIGFDL